MTKRSKSAAKKSAVRKSATAKKSTVNKRATAKTSTAGKSATAKPTRAKRTASKRTASKRTATKRQTKPRPAPYTRLLERRGSLSVWQVDGAFIRKNIEIEFSNFGSHYTITEIPKHEIWIDGETDPDEQRFFIAHAVMERRLLAKGTDADTARRESNHAERRLRVAAGDLRKVMRGRAVPNAELVKRELWKTLPSGVIVWFVKGRLVRSVYDIEYTEGGHEHVYERVHPQNGIYYFTEGASGELRPGNLKSSPITDKGFDSDRSFMLIEIAGDEMYFQTISRVGATVDSGVIRRTARAR